MLPNYENIKVDPEQFRIEIRKAYETDTMSNELGDMIMKLSKGIIYSNKFINYSDVWREEMVGNAIEKCVMAVCNKSFDVESVSSPFSYFYSIISNAYKNRINYNNKRRERLDTFIEMEFDRAMRDNPEHIYVKPDKMDFELWEEIEDSEEN